MEDERVQICDPHFGPKKSGPKSVPIFDGNLQISKNIKVGTLFGPDFLGPKRGSQFCTR